MTMHHRFFAAALLLVMAAPASAVTLTELLEKARASEPTLMGAQASVKASAAREKQALGAMLPQLSASATTYMNRRLYETLSSPFPAEKGEFNSHSGQVNLTQPLWRYASVMGYLQAESASRQAEFQLSGVEQELLSRLVSALFDVMAARDERVFQEQQLAAAAKQVDILRRGVAVGYRGQPELDEAQAKYEDIRANQSAAETEYEIKLAELEQLVGPLPDFMPPVLASAPALEPVPAESLDELLIRAEVSHPNVVVAVHAYEAARAEVRKQNAGHQPTLDLVANYNLNRQETGNFPGQNGYETRQSTVGLQLNVPLYAGGSQHAKAKEAVAMQEKARSELEAARRSARLSAKQAWFGMRSAESRLVAASQAVRAGDSSMQLARRGMLHGLKTEFDALQAEQVHGQARRDLNKARYQHISSYVRIKSLLGLASAADMAALDKALLGEPMQQVLSDEQHDMDVGEN